MRLRRILVVISRLIVGITFVIAGWAKAVDPWGFVIKAGEYLAVWDILLPHELVVAGCIALSCVEFCTGVMVLLGAFKRCAVWITAAFMLVMLPLTAYIAIADPVDDCGCFGDFIVISNTATFVKNIIISCAVVYLLMRNRSVPGLIPAPIQWIAVTASVAFPLYLSFTGYNVQPLVDFRPFKTGTQIFHPSDQWSDLEYIYEKDGEERRFTLENLPDSTWTYIDAVETGNTDGENESISVFDDEGNEVSRSLSENSGDCLYLIVANPDLQFLNRARFVNELADYGASHDCPMVGLLGVDDEALVEWKALVRPHFPVYTAEDTSLKMLARGIGALVFVRDGKIVWKRTLSSVSPALIYTRIEGNVLETIRPVDDGRLHLFAWAIYIGVMAVVYLLGLSPKLLPNHKK